MLNDVLKKNQNEFELNITRERYMKMKRLSMTLFLSLFLLGCTQMEEKPNVLFIMMDDLGYGQFGVYNDTLTVNGFNPFFAHLEDSLQGYSKEKALEFTKLAIPTITTLVEHGVLFTKAYTSSSLCSPSRLGIATATLQNKWGVYTLEDAESHGLVPGSHLAETFQQSGYKTAHIGKWHLGKHDEKIIPHILKRNGIYEKLSRRTIRDQYPDVYKEIENSGYLGSVTNKQNPLNNGFDYYYGYNYWASQFYNSTLVWENFKHAGKQEGYNTDVFTDKALDFMKEKVNRKEPFYVQLHYHAVHDSLEPKAPDLYLKRFNSESFHLNNFYAHIYGVDYNINRIVDFLKKKGIYENTIMVFTSDNGAMAAGSYNGDKTGSPLPGNAPFSGHKGNYYQGGFRVPLFIHWPKGIRKSGIMRNMVSTLDIMPTLLEATGLSTPDRLDGKSLLPVLKGQFNDTPHDYLVWSGIHSSAWGYLIEKTTKTHTTEREFAPPAWVIIKEDYLLRFTGKLEPGIYLEHMAGREPIMELFDIKNDPAERNNLVTEMPEKVKELSRLYFEDSHSFLPPVQWNLDKWKELKASKSLFN